MRNVRNVRTYVHTDMHTYIRKCCNISVMMADAITITYFYVNL